MIDYEKLYQKYSDNPVKWMRDNNCVTTKEVTIKLMKEAVKAAIPLILEAVSEKAKILQEELDPTTEKPLEGHAYLSNYFRGDLGYEDYLPVDYTIDKESITSLQDTLEKQLGI